MGTSAINPIVAVEPMLTAHAITVCYGDLAAVRNVSLNVESGEVVALFGPNGAGKSTTLMALAGLLPCKHGEVRWRGQRISSSLSHLARLARDGILMVPEGRTVTTRLSVRDNLIVGRGGVDGAVALFPELAPLLNRPAGLLSGGEQQILVLGRALAARPRVLLVDELSLGLAPRVVTRLLSAIRRAVDEQDLAVLLVEQQARRALTIADRWYLLSSGEVVAEGHRGGGAESLELAYLASMTGGPADTNEENA
jgi:branched-chain amino acid transport system ATP-binding protein